MKKPSIAILYFSGTGVTRTYTRTISDELVARGCEVRETDLTPHAAREVPFSLEGVDGVIFGFPVFSDFAPKAINEWLPTLDGRGKRCSLFFTYGGRTTGYAHFHTAMLLEKSGFTVLMSAEFPGRHSLNLGGWKALPGRPDEDDLALARLYAGQSLEGFTRDTPHALRLQKPFGYNHAVGSLNAPPSGERHWAHPVRTLDECSMCRLCEEECPTLAFDADTGLSDPLKCISCLHCVASCPDKAIKLGESMIDYSAFLTNWNMTEEMIQAKRGKILTEPLQANW